MWEFPSSPDPLRVFGVLILSVLILIVVCWLAGRQIYLSLKESDKDARAQFYNGVGALVIALSIFALLIYVGISQHSTLEPCRTLDLQKVQELRVWKMRNENDFLGKPVRLFDSGKIQEGLKTLRRAADFDRRRKKLLNGYRIDLIIENHSSGQISLYYFAETDERQKPDVVVLDCGENLKGIQTGSNVFSSPAFGTWVRENIEPKFNNPQ